MLVRITILTNKIGEFIPLFFKLFFEVSNIQLVLTFVLSIGVSLFFKDINTLLGLSLAAFSVIARNAYLLRQKHSLNVNHLLLKPFQDFTMVESVVFAWSYLALLFLFAGTFARSFEVETFFGFWRPIYLSIISLGFLINLRATVILGLHGLDKAMLEYALFVLVCLLPILLIEIAFGGPQLWGIPRELLVAKVMGDMSTKDLVKLVVPIASNASMFVLGLKWKDEALAAEQEVLKQDVQRLTGVVEQQSTQLSAQNEILRAYARSQDMQVETLKMHSEQLRALQESNPSGSINRGFAVQGLPAPASEEAPVVLDGPDAGTEAVPGAGDGPQAADSAVGQVGAPDVFAASVDNGVGPTINTAYESGCSILAYFI